MKKLVFALLAYCAMYVPAQAELIITTFDDWKVNPVQIGDKLFTYTAGGDNFNNAEVRFSSNNLPGQTVYDMDILFAPSLNNTTIDLDYSVEVTNPNLHLSGLGVDSQIGALGTNFNLVKTFYSSPNHVGQVAQLISANGSNAAVLGNFGQTIYTHVQATVPVGNVIDSFRDEYTQSANANPVPEPSSIALLTLGCMGLGIGSYRRRRQSRLAV